MAKIFTNVEQVTTIDEQGNSTISTKETTSKLEVSTEPDFIKIYTRMWCEFNDIPMQYRELFFQLAIRMSYCDKADLEHSQTVITYGSVKKSIQAALNWGDAMFYRGMQALCNCGAIRKLSRSEYQINPNYAGRGSWKYNPRTANGGVEDLVATFNFKQGTVKTDVVWADDGTDNPMNDMYRTGMGVKASDRTVLSTRQIKAAIDDEIPGQMNIEDLGA